MVLNRKPYFSTVFLSFFGCIIFRNTALHKAIVTGGLDVVRLLLQRGANVQAKASIG